MKTLHEHLIDAEDGGYALGHINISNIDMLWPLFEAARELDVPLVIGTSGGERESIGITQAVLLVKSLREEFEYPIFINADHCHSLDSFKEAVDAGYDMAIIDKAAEDLEENIRISKQAVEYAREHNPGMLVEGEVGYIGQSSSLLDSLPEGAVIDGKGLVTPDIAERYTEETGVDLFAPAVGNVHGMLKGSSNPALHIDLIRDIQARVRMPLVLHGGSGVTDEDFVASIQAGITMVHISTEIRVLYRKTLEESLASDPEQIAPYKYIRPVREALKEKAKERLKLFSITPRG